MGEILREWRLPQCVERASFEETQRGFDESAVGNEQYRMPSIVLQDSQYSLHSSCLKLVECLAINRLILLRMLPECLILRGKPTAYFLFVFPFPCSEIDFAKLVHLVNRQVSVAQQNLSRRYGSGTGTGICGPNVFPRQLACCILCLPVAEVG